MAFSGAFGLTALPAGFMQGSEQTFDFNQKQRDAQQKSLADTLTGDALMSLQQGGALQGAGGGQAQQPPGVAQPPPAAPQQPRMAGPPPIQTRDEQEKDPRTWGSTISVDGVPKEIPSGVPYSPRAEQLVQQTGGRGLPNVGGSGGSTGQPQAQPQAQPQEQPYGGQRFAQQAQGQLTLQGAIQAVTQAARRRGEQATPDVIYKAVSNMLPLLNAQSQQQYREWSLMMREQGLQQKEESIRNLEEYRQYQKDIGTQKLQLEAKKEFRRIDHEKFTEDQAMKDYDRKIREFTAKQQWKEADEQIKLMHTRAVEIIAASGLDDEKLTAVLKENQEFFDQMRARLPQVGTTSPTATTLTKPPPIKWDPNKGFSDQPGGQ